MDIIKNILLLLVGMALLIKGADYFVSGSSNLAKKLRIPSIIIGLTIVSFGTSLPEASVSIFSAIQGSADLSLGNVVGSNIFNILIVLGFSAIMMPVIIKQSSLKSEMPFLLLTTLIIIFFSFNAFLIKGQNNYISVIEGIVLLVFFIIYLYMMIVLSKKINRKETIIEDTSHIKLSLSSLLLLIGLGGIILGGKFVTDSASFLAIKLGMSEALVGLTIVAVGTSLPELVTSVVAAKKNENDIAFGNVIGSNIFNVLFIVGTAAVIKPLNVNPKIAIDMVIMLLTTIIVFAFAITDRKITKKEGVILISMYLVYLAYIIARN